LRNPPPDFVKFTCFLHALRVFHSPYFYHDAFIHHTIHILDAPRAPVVHSLSIYSNEFAYIIKVVFCISSVLETATASQQMNRKDNKMDASGTNKSYDVRLENFDVSYADR